MSLVSDAGSRRSSAFCATIGVPLAKSSSKYAGAAIAGGAPWGAAAGGGLGDGAAAMMEGHAATANAAAMMKRDGDIARKRTKASIIAPSSRPPAALPPQYGSTGRYPAIFASRASSTAVIAAPRPISGT